MQITSTFRQRAIVLIAACMALGLAAVPFLGNAQDATPDASPVAADNELLQTGEDIFSNVCLACHQPDGQGIQGIYPALAGNPLLTTDDATYFIQTVLTGRGGMPRFNTTYDDAEIAGVVSYVRQAWENDAGAVTPEQVAEVRAAIQAEYEEGPLDATPGGQVPSDEADD